jgi:hypothetical protein
MVIVTCDGPAAVVVVAGRVVEVVVAATVVVVDGPKYAGLGVVVDVAAVVLVELVADVEVGADVPEDPPVVPVVAVPPLVVVASLVGGEVLPPLAELPQPANSRRRPAVAAFATSPRNRGVRFDMLDSRLGPNRPRKRRSRSSMPRTLRSCERETWHPSSSSPLTTAAP